MLLDRSLTTALLALAVAGPAAAVTPYVFQTSGSAFGNPSPVLSAFAPSDKVQGQFMLDYGSPPSTTLGDGSTQYGGNVLGMSGTTKGLVFTDPSATTRVGNDRPVDLLQVRADPPIGVGSLLPRNIVGFQLAGYQLVDVRLFWTEGNPGIGDFLTGQTVPDPLPAFAGRLALDFVEGGNLSLPLTSVFFDGMTVVAVPEPGTTALWLSGLGFLGWLVRYRRG